MEIPKILIDQIRQGQVVLFLGSGASFGAKHPEKKSPPIGNQLASLICDKFLGEEYKHLPLTQVAELAISESSLFDVQSFVAEIFKDFEPASFHELIPKFIWSAIITTNYDLIIEKAYQNVTNSLQNIVVFKKDTERVEEKLKKQNQTMYIKLHGCITDINDPTLPLILTPEQYITHKENRTQLFNRLFTLSINYPFLFIGHSLSDSDLRAIMLELDKLKDAKPRSYLITPILTEAEKRFWSNKKLAHIQMSFEDFINTLNHKIPDEIRKLGLLIEKNEHQIIKKFSTKENIKFSESLETLLERDVEFVNSTIKVSTLDPKTFYKGYFNSFAPILLELDVRMSINDKMLSEIFLVTEELRREIVEFDVVLGHAGSGKTVSLKRLAYDASVIFDKLCLFAKNNVFINYDALYELHQYTNERIFLFIDPVTDSYECLQEILVRAKKDKLPLTVIAGERKNEWNTNCEELKAFVNHTYEMKYLSEKEIEILIDLLSKHKSLGHLEGLSFEKQKTELSQKAGRQILVALHEATMGKPFSDIILDEYKSIPSPKAQSLYLTICILHRLGIPVRAGLISRAHNISFTEFKSKFFNPLEYIVFTTQDDATKDYYYQSRHSHIAEIVFERVLVSPQDRYDEYMRIIKSLDLGYNSDSESFKSLMKGRQLISLYPDPNMIRQLYEFAHSIKANDPMLLQQEAIFEMNCRGGNITRAEKLLEKAYDIAPHNSALAHSMSVLDYQKSKKARNIIEKNKYREDSKKIALDLITNNATTSHPYHTIVSISLDELEELLSAGDQASIERKLKDIEKLISSSIQKFPDEAFLLDAEAKYASLLKQNPKALESLEKAFETNKRSSYLASRLAQFYENEGNESKAISVLRECIDANPADKNANYKLSTLLLKYDKENLPEIKFHLRRSFTEGDSNYIAQFWYARAIYMMNEFDDANKIFKTLSNLNIDSRIKKSLRAVIKDGETDTIYTGVIIHLESSYGFISRDGTQDNIYCYHAFTIKDNWESLKSNDRISFSMGFNYHGPIAINIIKL